MFGRSEKDQKDTAPLTSSAQVPAAAPAPTPRTATVSAPAARPVDEVAFFGKGCKISGKLAFEGKVRIDGRVDGEIHAKDALELGESAEVTAEIHAGTVTLRGVVRGDIHATRRVEIRAPGRLYGNISTPTLVIDEGVVFEGSCLMESVTQRSENKVASLARKEEPPPALQAGPSAASAKLSGL